MLRRLASFLTAFAFVACASEQAPPRPPEQPLFVDGVRQKPITNEEVTAQVGTRRSRLAACYRSERLNTKELARFLFELTIPNDGSEAPVEMLTMEPQGQPILEACVAQALKSLRFPPHIGEVRKLRVPIEPMDSF